MSFSLFFSFFFFFFIQALKESFIKAIGTGLGFNLQRAEFHLSPKAPTLDRVVRQTRMYLDEEEEPDWVFEVSPPEGGLTAGWCWPLDDFTKKKKKKSMCTDEKV